MDIFQQFNVHLEEENEIREKIREIVRYVGCHLTVLMLTIAGFISFFRQIDTESKEANAGLQVIHTSLTQIGEACQKARKTFERCSELFKELKKIVPAGQYYR